MKPDDHNSPTYKVYNGCVTKQWEGDMPMIMMNRQENKSKKNWSNLTNKYLGLLISSPLIKRILLLAAPILLSLLIMSPAAPVQCTDEESSGIKVYCNGEYQGSTAYIDPDSGVGMLPLALIQTIPGLRLDVRDTQAWFSLNGRQLTAAIGSKTYTIDGQDKTWRCGIQPWQYGLAVPGRDLLEALGAGVSWNDTEKAIYITVPVPVPAVPINLSPISLPLRLALIQDEQLWLLDTSKPGAQPFLVPSRNVEQIIGWSHDGNWLAYLQRVNDDKYSGDMSLWVVSSDGQQTQCLDELPLAYCSPVWSPTEDTIAYETLLRDQEFSAAQSLKIAVAGDGGWQHRELSSSAVLPLGLGLTWYPDGSSLVVSRLRDKENTPEIDQIDLKGGSSCLFVLPEDVAGDYQSGLYIQDISGLKLSPDARYLACFLGMNSGSINADGMSLQIIDLSQRKLADNLGVALGYPEWVQWSRDSKKLAAIMGSGRMASTNKHLAMVEVGTNGVSFEDLGEVGQTDSKPVWSADSTALYFSRGQESAAWLEEGRHQEIQVPGQRICCLRDDQVQSLSQPGSEQADYPLSLSPDGQYLVMQRLSYVDQGDLFMLNLKDSQLIKLMDNIQANAGYYGNYCPDMISVYWLEK
jgi:hypothetical protein